MAAQVDTFETVDEDGKLLGSGYSFADYGPVSNGNIGYATSKIRAIYSHT